MTFHIYNSDYNIFSSNLICNESNQFPIACFKRKLLLFLILNIFSIPLCLLMWFLSGYQYIFFCHNKRPS